jgi:predicted TPR repeat methyltransferase
VTSNLFRSSGDLIADRRHAIGRDFAVRDDYRAAADMFMQAVEAAPGFVSAWFALGEMLEKLGDLPAAVVAFRKAKELDPKDAHGAGVHLMRLKAEAVHDMPRDYVRTLFDQYASRFDEALVGKLAYRGPELLLDAVTRACAQAKRPVHFAAALDLGCGTGLGGALFRKLCGRLTGMDLSPQMVEQARGKHIYDRLEIGDIPAFLAAEKRTARYHLVLAADVFTYLADLRAAIDGCAQVLEPGGLLAFTVETHTGSDVILGDKLRYAHGAAHVQDAFRHAGLRLLILENASSRNDGGSAVPGLVVVATK